MPGDKKKLKITLPKEKLRPRERAPILPSKQFEDKRRRDNRRAKHKKKVLTTNEED